MMICPTCRTERAVNKSGAIRRHVCVAPDTTAVVELGWSTPPMTKNMVRRLHFQTEAKLRDAAVTEARWKIRAALRRGELAPMSAANITLHWRQPDHRKRDGDGADPTKALVIDALVREEVLPDDSWAYVRHSGVTCHPPQKGMPGALWVELREPDQGEE